MDAATVWNYGLPLACAVFLWWASTGLILYLDGLPTRTFPRSMVAASFIACGALFGLHATATDTTVSSAYLSFIYGLLAWGWIEISFYTGWVTGPRQEPCTEDCKGWRHFGHAIQASLYHEIAILAGAALVFLLTKDAPNQIGTWTFMVLWWMHQSAKINVFLGVPNLSLELLPDHLDFLRVFFTNKPMNLLFPVSITLLTIAATLLGFHLAGLPSSSFEAAGVTLILCLVLLGLLEHWFLVLPLPTAALWNWSLRSRTAAPPTDIEIVAGFLGAGKTTFLRRVISNQNSSTKTVILANDFAALNIDSSLLANPGTDVIELANGCLCCSLRNDFTAQLLEILRKHRPERIYIEPSGVANLSTLLSALEHAELRPSVRSLNVSTVIDAAAFRRDIGRLADYFSIQIRLSPRLIVNKCDLISAEELRIVLDTLITINPDATITTTRFGMIQGETVKDLGARKPATVPADDTTVATKVNDEALLPELTSWSAYLPGAVDPQGLRQLLEAATRGAFGTVERIKGIAKTEAGWIHFDVAGGRSSILALTTAEAGEARVIAIGSTVDEARLQAAFDACAATG